jgi:hypothetical protein
MTHQDLNKELTIDQIENELLHIGKCFPKEAVQAAIAQQADITPKLLAWLEKAIEDVDSIENKDIGYFFAIFLLSQFKEKSAFASIIRLARLPEKDLDSLIGDSITEGLHRFIASTYNDDLVAIKSLIEDVRINEWSRKAGLRALFMLANEGRIDLEETLRYIASLFTHPSFTHDEDEQTTHLVTVCCDFLPHRFEEEIRQAFKEGRVDTFVINMEDVQRCMARESTYCFKNYTLITDTIAEMERWPCFNKSNKTFTNPSNPKWYEDLPSSMVSVQIVRGGPKIGRNELCPCNSGKKYKKCCLQT